MSDILKVIEKRRSIRKYKQTDVPKELIESVIQAANWAPSNGNSQPWDFIVVKDDYAQQICDLFYEWAEGYIPGADYIPAEKKPIMLQYAKSFGGAPVQIIITYDLHTDVIKTEESLMAACAAVQNLLLQATECGLGTVWIAGHTAHNYQTKEILNIGPDKEIAGIIPIGYPDMEPPAPPRMDPELTQKVKWLGF